MRIRIVALIFVASSLLGSASALAQGLDPVAGRHVADAAILQKAIAVQTVTDQQNRDAVLGVLHQSQALAIANRLGLSVTRADAAVATLSSADLANLAVQARAANTQLAGGSSITISVTMLLVIIILVLLLR